MPSDVSGLDEPVHQSCIEEFRSECWTINVGGGEGLWRLLHSIEGMENDSRPALVHLQETSCGPQQWIAVEKFARKLGYRSFHTEGTADSRPRSGAWKRGIITMVDEKIKCRWVDGHSWRNGQYHAVVVGDILTINSYAPPDEESIVTQLSHIEGFFEKQQWLGRWMMGGDWNEALTMHQGGEVQDLCLVSNSRWDNDKVIDYWVSNFEIGPGFRRSEKVSDHCIVTTDVTFTYEMDSSYCRFAQPRQFRCPEWISKKKWEELFALSFRKGVDSHWEDAVARVEKLDWPSEVGVQELIDYQWAMMCSKLMWCFAMASSLAILYIPLDYQNLHEIKLVVANANSKKIKGIDVVTQDRVLPRKVEKSSEAKRKLYCKAGRLEDLVRRLQRGDRGVTSRNLIKKLFQNSLVDEISLKEATDLLDETKSKIKSQEGAEKASNLSSWRKKMKFSLKARGEWINKKGNVKSPTVRTHKAAETRKEGAAMIHNYWSNFWEKQHWEEEDRQLCIEEITDFINQKMQDKVNDGCRPALQDFRQGLCRINGTHGIDGWAACELKTISSCLGASHDLWETIQLWEEEGVLPGAINQCKLVCVAKKDQHFLEPQQYRPICVLSSIWRAWSSTWIRSTLVKNWIGVFFPPEVGGGIPGSLGPEVLSSIVDHDLGIKKHGASLDFRHAFDSVDLGMMKAALSKSLPVEMKGWVNLLFLQWCSMQRWIMYDGTAFPRPMVVQCGLPQGDPAAPLIMNILVHNCMNNVNKCCNDPSMLHVTYMDDRTLVADSKASIALAESAWEEQALKYHLLENSQKAQHVDCSKQQSMEVLGAAVGNPSSEENLCSKSSNRLKAAEMKYKRIGFLPLTIDEKLKTANRHAFAGLDYGWVSSDPNSSQLKRQEIALWKSLGRTRYVSPLMRGVMVGANSHLHLVVLRKQIRMLAKRNQAMRRMGSAIHNSSLENMVKRKLASLGWLYREGKWVHPLHLCGFKIDEMVDDKIWAKTSHALRESYRQSCFNKLRRSGRHDAQCIGDELYSPSRRKLAISWAGANFTAYLLVCGGIASPLQRATTGKHRVIQRCPRCDLISPEWDHLWRCFAGTIPADGLLRRFLWPRSRKDFSLCNAFLSGMQAMRH